MKDERKGKMNIDAKEKEAKTLKDYREYIWEYFKVHAQQRMALFNYFVVFSSLVTTGLISTFQRKIQAYLVGAELGVLLMMISFIFWKLDQRVGFLIKHAENALKWIESKLPYEKYGDKSNLLQVFKLEEFRTDSKREQYWYKPHRWHLTYSECFKLAFLAFGLIGLLGTAVSLYLCFV